jgi:hypothetical protein
MNRILLIPAALRRWFPGQSAWFVEQVAGEVACRCRPSLWQRTCRETATMSVSEIRGYVRAQASGLVAPEVDAALANHGIRQTLRPRVIDSAVERLIAMMIRDALSEQPACEMKMIAA